MTELIREVANSVVKEYDRASKEYGPVHNSDHEGFAVMEEEFEEARDNLDCCEYGLKELWSLVKDKTAPDDIKIDKLKIIYQEALFGACEMIQTAAMAHKAIRTIEERGKS